jgi:hypothetical protein
LDAIFAPQGVVIASDFTGMEAKVTAGYSVSALNTASAPSL